MKRHIRVRLEEVEFDFLAPDKNRLDDEWVNQPKFVFTYIKEYEQAREDEAAAKAELDVISAECDKEIRDAPGKYSLPDKLTETLITKTILLQPEYQEALKKARKLQHRIGVLRAAITALEHRKSALERLVSLHGQNYFATPKAPDEASQKTVDDLENKHAKERRQAAKKRKKRE